MAYLNLFVVIILLAIFVDVSFSTPNKKNVLFLVSDDMRPNIGAYYGPDFPSPIHPPMMTPNLDKLASKSLLLKRAYVQLAVCSPSRTSLLTGRRPDTTHVYVIGPYFRNVGGNFTTIPQYFKENGYQSVGMGKVFHPGHASGNDDPISWSEPYYHAPSQHYWGFANHTNSWLAATKEDRAVHELPDIQITNHAVQTLRRLAPKAKSGEKPFFLAVGFRKPHLPFIFPEEFLQYYPKEKIRLPDNPYAPVNMPIPAFYICDGLLEFKDILKLNATIGINTTHPLPPNCVMDLRRAYYSAITFVDSLIGNILNELQSLGLAENTIVSFWGDHGWQLGEHGLWCKQTNFELATHAPMMVHVPGMTDHGVVTEALTEFVDLFPTLVEAADLPPLPLCPENSVNVTLCREGRSLIPLMRDPSTKLWKDRAFSQYPRKYKGLNLMGYTMRTDRYRYTEWAQFNYNTNKPDWKSIHGAELYDHLVDPEENWNRAAEKNYKYIQEKLSNMLHGGWRGVM